MTFEIDNAEQLIASVPEAEAPKAAEHLRAFYGAARTAGVQTEYLCKIAALLAWNADYPNDIAAAALRLSEEKLRNSGPGAKDLRWKSAGPKSLEAPDRRPDDPGEGKQKWPS